MDGTLVDSTAVVDSILGEFAQDFELDPEFVLQHAHGLRTLDQIRLFLPDVSAQEHARIEAHMDHLEAVRTDGITEIPGARKFLRSLDALNLPYAIVTSASLEVAVARLTAAGLPVPERIITAESTPYGKPSPIPYQLGAQLLDLEPTQCIAFEDAEAGLLSAVSAGAKTVVVGAHRSDLADSLPRIASFAHSSLMPTPAGYALQNA